MSIQDGQMYNRNRQDIAYGFILGTEGTVFEGRGFDLEGESHISQYLLKQ